MVGYPGETVESIEKTFALVLSLPLDEAWFTIPLPLPGTPLFARVADLRKWEDWEVSNQVKFVFPSEFDERWLERRISETTEAFRKKKGIPEKSPKKPEYPDKRLLLFSGIIPTEIIRFIPVTRGEDLNF